MFLRFLTFYKFLFDAVNELPVLPSIICQHHHFWQVQACPVSVFVARLVDGSKVSIPERSHSVGMTKVPRNIRRRRKFRKFDYKMVHSEVYLNK